MTTSGIDGILVETHNWGKSVKFWAALGYELELDTGHHSGRLRHPAGGPYVFIAERPATQELQVILGFRVEDAATFTPPKSGKVKQKFAKQHWGALQMLIADPDGRVMGVEAPLKQKRAAKTRKRQS